MIRCVPRLDEPAIDIKAGQSPLNPTKPWDIETDHGEEAAASAGREQFPKVGLGASDTPKRPIRCKFQLPLKPRVWLQSREFAILLGDKASIRQSEQIAAEIPPIDVDRYSWLG